MNEKSYVIDYVSILTWALKKLRANWKLSCAWCIWALHVYIPYILPVLTLSLIFSYSLSLSSHLYLLCSCKLFQILCGKEGLSKKFLTC